MDPKPKVLLGQVLVTQKVITTEQLDIALQKQKETGDLLGMTLLKLGFIDEETVFLPVIANQLGVEFVNLQQFEIAKDVIGKIPAKFASYYKMIPLEYRGGTLTIATQRPLDIHVIDAASMVSGERIKTVLANEKDIMDSIGKYYGVGAETIDQMMDMEDLQSPQEKVEENIESIDSEASIAKFLNQIISEAYRSRATDIHIEPFEQSIKIRYRIDGVLSETKLPTGAAYFRDSIISRIKIMSNLNIAEKRLPQDGRFKMKVDKMDLDLRVSFLPSQFGESVVIRILQSSNLYSLKDLGLVPAHLQILNDLLAKPHGIIFVTGPTGSGKTTTLYSGLSHINTPDKKIITIEDPIEYQLNNVIQIAVHPEIGLTFARGLRSMLRHDPDVMMVGEVRDMETAKIAIQIAMTGHLVFSTLHTNDAASGVSRLMDMGIPPYLITSSVECFIAQRLVRLLCPKCKTPITPSEEVIQNFELDPQQAKNLTLFEHKGCKACQFTGYRGRSGIYEFLVLNDEIREMILNRASSTQLKSKAVEQGMATLLQSGWEKVRQGVTSASEVLRVTKEDPR